MKGLRKRISWQIGIWFFVLALLPLTSGALIIRHITYELIVKDSTSRLVNLLNEKKQEIESYIRSSKQVVKTLAQVPAVIQSLDHASRMPVPIRPILLDKWMKDVSSFLNTSRALLGYQDVLLIDKEGHIVYSIAQAEDLGMSLQQFPYRKSGLAEAFDMVTTQLSCEISQFIYYPPMGKLAAFIAVPVQDNGALLGVLAVQLNEEHLFRIFTSYLGLGKSGEVVAARKQADGSVVTAGPLRNQPNALEKGMDFSDQSEIPILRAMRGEQSAGLAVDYRGREIVAAWNFLPSLSWGMVVKMDQEEAFSSLQRQDVLIAILLFISLLLVLVGILLATRKITSPIKALTTTVQKFAKGDFKDRATVSSDNEVGVLSKGL